MKISWWIPLAIVLTCGTQSSPRISLPQQPRGPLDIWADLPPPPLMKGIGNASLRITTNSVRAQAYFNQGLRLLDAFWYFEAYRAFRECAELDPSTAMAYWGMAQALSNFPTLQRAAGAAIEKAESLMGRTSDHERYYIRAATDLARDSGARGSEGYVQEMQSVLREYPDDLNAPALLAFFVMSGFDPSGHPTTRQLYAEALLRRVLAEHPDDVAANHFWVHAVEGGSAPQDGLDSALLISRLAPNSGHLVHMVGHIYFLLGDYEKAREAFLHSMRVDEAYLKSEHIPPEDDSNYEHNLSYLVADCAEEGRYQESLKWADKLDGLRASFTYGASALNYAIPVGSTLLRVHLRYGDWQAAANDPIYFGVQAAELDSGAQDYERAWHLYARAMAEIQRAQNRVAVRLAGEDLLALDTALANLTKSQEGEPRVVAYWTGGAVRLLAVASDELRGSLEWSQGKYAAGLRAFRDAVEGERNLGYTEPPYYARPVEEAIGNAYLGMHAWAQAREAFRQELRLRPQSGFALFGIAESYELEGDVNRATPAYRSFLAAWHQADPDLPQVLEARKWLATHR